MALRPENLPRDPDRLIEMVLACEGKIEALQATITTLKTMIFGARSEKSAVIIAEQLSLGLGDAETDAALPPPANDDHKTKAAPGSRNKRNRNIGALPKHLPRCDVTIEPETTACPCCAGALHRIGEDVSEVLDKVPAILRVLRFIRPKYACRSCEGTVVQAKARPRLIESGMASTALVAWIAAAKFAWGSTLYRQAQILAGHGLNIDRQTLARWMKQAAWMAKGVYELQLAAMHEHPRLFCDETPMPVLDPGRGRTRTCQFWAHATDDRSWKGPAPPAGVLHFASELRPGLWALLDRTARDCWPTLLRGDASFGNEPIMHEAEQRGLAYLFKLRLTANVRRAIERLSSEREWVDAGQGWQAKESAVRLAGWSRQRRIIVLRRRVKGALAASSGREPGPPQLSFLEIGPGDKSMSIAFWPPRSSKTSPALASSIAIAATRRIFSTN